MEGIFGNSIMSILVPQGWNFFYGIDSEGNVSEKKLHVFKNAETEYDIFSRAGLTICFYGKEDIFVSARDTYNNVQDIGIFEPGGYAWTDYTCTSFGYPYTMLTSFRDGRFFT